MAPHQTMGYLGFESRPAGNPLVVRIPTRSREHFIALVCPFDALGMRSAPGS